ncbi:MAG: leucyl aminopeptidase [Clostridium sp.]
MDININIINKNEVENNKKLMQNANIIFLTIEEVEKILNKKKTEISTKDIILKDIVDKKIFTGDLGQVYYVKKENTSKEKIYVGIGKLKELKYDDVRIIGYNLGKKLSFEKIFNVNIKKMFKIKENNKIEIDRLIEALAEGILHSKYNFTKYIGKAEKAKKEQKDNKPKEEINVNIYVNEKEEKIAKKGLKEAKLIVSSMDYVRDIINEPSNVMYPETIANSYAEYLKGEDISVEILELEQIEKLNMQAFLNVAKGSSKEPKLFVAKYMGDKNSNEVLALVGKGITYDSGGLGIKPALSMSTMFTDMGGSATVVGALKLIAQQKVKKNVYVVTALCENMINGDSYKNGDIIGSMSGKTIEIGHTDAEGRLTLADAVYYATNVLKATKVIDIATLTGSAVMTFSEYVTPIITNNEKMYKSLEKASLLAGEDIWKMPNLKVYASKNKSKVADLTNSAKCAGMITAGQFVGEFIPKETPWIHIDIAGTSYLSAPYKYHTNGATAIMVKTLYYLAKEV